MFLKKYWPTIVAAAGALLPFLLPSLKAYVAANPHTAIGVLLACVIAAYHAPSPNQQSAPSNPPAAGATGQQTLKAILFALCLLGFAHISLAQTAKPAASAFTDTTVSFGLTPVTLPSLGKTLAGAVTETSVNISTNNALGEMTLISTSPFVAGEYARMFPGASKWIQSHTNFAGANFQIGIKAQFGVVKAAKSYWGEGAAVFVNYAPSGSSSFGLGLQAGWMNLPGIQHNVPEIAVGPNFHF